MTVEPSTFNDPSITKNTDDFFARSKLFILEDALGEPKRLLTESESKAFEDLLGYLRLNSCLENIVPFNSEDIKANEENFKDTFYCSKNVLTCRKQKDKVSHKTLQIKLPDKRGHEKTLIVPKDSVKKMKTQLR